jgi:hypothetical protein
MKWPKRLLWAVLVIGGLVFIQRLREGDHYNTGEKGNYKINVGETIKVNIYVNGSTGYSNCWLNEKKSDCVAFIENKWWPSLPEMVGLIGAGSSETLVFKGIRTGIDTIKIGSCPTGREQRDCSWYTENSVRPENEVSLVNEFVVVVEE